MLAKVSLFTSKRDFFIFLLACGVLLSHALFLEYKNYKILTKFDTALVHATVLNQYTKTKGDKTYQVLKFKSDEGFVFYTTKSRSFAHAKGQKFTLEITTEKITFYSYLTSFFAYSTSLERDCKETLKEKFNHFLASKHENQEIANIYQALYTATPLEKNLQSAFSVLGISHLLAISGFHLGVLSAVLYFLLQYPYKILQNRYFPYRNAKADLFCILCAILLLYLLFLDSPASLLRAFGMFVVGFVLYDRGMKIVSMQTLLVSVLLLVALFPRLFFALGFWLSVSGVFYIFLFLIHLKHLHALWKYLLLPIFVYLLMLPFSLVIFGSFGLYHPLSVVWTSLFTLFYPLSIFLHLVGFADVFDTSLIWLIKLGEEGVSVTLNAYIFVLYLLLSFLSIFKKYAMWALFLLACGIFVYAVISLH